MQGPCSIDGNIGMPLQLSGEIQVADKEKLNDLLPNDLVFTFSSFRTKPTLLRDTGGIALPSGSSQSLILRDANYNLISASICRPQHSNFSDSQSNVIAEIIFTFMNARPSQERPYLFFLCFPLFKSAAGSSAPFLKGLLTNEPLTAQMSVLDLVNESKTFIFYNSCLPLVSKTQTVVKSYSCCALVSTHSLPVYESDVKNNLTRLMDYMLPSSLTMDVDTIVDYKINSSFVFDPNTIKRGTAGKTYRATVQTNTSGFFTRFSKYVYNPVVLAKANQQACKTSSQINTSQLKCFAIKPKTDVRNGVLLVDPRTGKRMDKLLAEGEPGNITPGSSNKAAMVFGIIFGLLGIVLGGFLAYKLVLEKSFTDNAPASVSAGATALPLSAAQLVGAAIQQDAVAKAIGAAAATVALTTK